MKTEQEIMEEINMVQERIRRNLEDRDAEQKRGHTTSAQVHEDYARYLQGYRDGLKWVIE
jgi:hypothetical protein